MSEASGQYDISLRDKLYKKFGTEFRSSHQDFGTIQSPLEVTYPWASSFMDDFLNFFSDLKTSFNFHMLADISVEEMGSERIIHYGLLNLENYFRLQISMKITQGPFIPSLQGIWKSAIGLEKELEVRHKLLVSKGSASKQRHILKKLELEQDDKSTPRELPRYELPVIPSEKDLVKKWYQAGPLSAPLKGKARIDFLIDEEKVYDCVLETGFCHRNIEKMILTKPLERVSFFMERLCTRDSVFAPLIWNEALESRYQIVIPEKAQAIRMVWMEMARIEGHLSYLQELTGELGFLIESSALTELIEQIYHLYNLHSGKNQNFSLFSVGGMKQDLPMGWATECLEVVKYIYKELESVQSKIVRNKSWMSLTSSNPMNATMALEYALTGPNLRACGVNYDLRKRRPRYLYSDVDFQVPLGIDGTTYDRFLVRIEEIKQSIKIINQVLDHLPAGSVLNPEWKERDIVQEQSAPEGLTYNIIESTEGELGLLVKSDEQHNLTHFHIRSPSYVHFHSYPSLVKGESISNALTAFLSLGIDAWEMDR